MQACVMTKMLYAAGWQPRHSWRWPIHLWQVSGYIMILKCGTCCDQQPTVP